MPFFHSMNLQRSPTDEVTDHLYMTCQFAMPCCPIPTYFNSCKFFSVLTKFKIQLNIFLKNIQYCSASASFDVQSQLIKCHDSALIFTSKQTAYPRARMDLWCDSFQAQPSSQMIIIQMILSPCFVYFTFVLYPKDF